MVIVFNLVIVLDLFSGVVVDVVLIIFFFKLYGLFMI